MGLFARKGATVHRVGKPQERAAVEQLLKRIGRDVESTLRDAASEYVVLQAGGMLVATELGMAGTFEDASRVVDDEGHPSAAAAVASAQSLLAQHHGCSAKLDSRLLIEHTDRIERKLYQVVQRKEVSAEVMVAAINDLLTYYETYLPPRRAGDDRKTLSGVSTALLRNKTVAMLPALCAMIGTVIGALWFHSWVKGGGLGLAIGVVLFLAASRGRPDRS